jgi:hypothetical protein
MGFILHAIGIIDERGEERALKSFRKAAAR